MVEPSSPCPPGEKPIAPLNIRKVSGASSSTGSASRPSGNDIIAGKAPRGGRFYDRRRPNITIYKDDDAAEDKVLEAGKDESMSKRKNWWSRKDKAADRPEGKDTKDTENDAAKHKRQWEDLDDRVDRQNRRSPATTSKVHGKNGSDQISQASSEFPMRVDVPEPPKTIAPKKSFLDMFKKRVGEKTSARPSPPSPNGLALGGTSSPASSQSKQKEKKAGMLTWYNCAGPSDASSSTLAPSFDISHSPSRPSDRSHPSASHHSGSSSTITPGAAVEYQSNWLQRFLHIKPASRVFCFGISRGKARSELVRVMREWKKFGIRDVKFDRGRNTITARVDKANRKQTLVSLPFPELLTYLRTL